MSLSEEAVTTLVTLLKSHYQSVRQSSLEILSTTLVAPDSGGKLAEASKRCLAAESVPLTVQGVRERVLRIGRVGQVIQDGDESAALLCATWLVGQLTVSLRPVWSPAAGAIASLAERFPETVWELVFGELEAVQTSAKQGGPDWCVASGSKTEGVNALVDEVEEANEQERSWRDPSAYKLRAVVKSWLSDEKCRKNVIEVGFLLPFSPERC
jgi:U3 small nucleolar RNA-associated protein 20